MRGRANADAIQDALSRLHLVRCYNTYQLLATLTALPTMLAATTPQVVKERCK